MVYIKAYKMYPDVELPVQKHTGDAGWDVYAYIPDGQITLKPFQTTIIKTGLKLKIPEGYEVQVRSRSGLATKGLFVTNSPGTIDAGYEGEVGIIVTYMPPSGLDIQPDRVQLNNHTEETFVISNGDRIAQLVIKPVVDTVFKEIKNYTNESNRGPGGFGSTGT